MKKFNFIGDISEVCDGLAELSSRLGFRLSSDGIIVRVTKTEEKKLLVSFVDGEFKIAFCESVMFFRGLSYILSEGEGVSVEETPCFESNGAMLDVNQGNAAPTLDTFKNILACTALMGLNRYYIYMEDSFDVDGEPYFGYMRSRYSATELRELDDFAFMLGIELIPCMQTLGHLETALRWAEYGDIKENDSVLLVGEEKTYAFIEKMLDAASKPFRTNKIHIGLDEAWNLGLGSYLRLHGYRPTYDIMKEHIDRVLEMCKSRGLEPMIWSDMFLRTANKIGNAYDDHYCVDNPLSQNVIDSAPKDIGYVFWDYCHIDEDKYEALLKRNFLLGPDVIFAGGIWSWTSFGVDYPKTFRTSISALSACKKCGVKNVFATIWGGTGEHNVYTSLLGMQLWAELDYGDGFDKEKLRKRFRACTGAEYDDFWQTGYFDNMFGEDAHDGLDYTNLSEYVMWQDALGGFFDRNIEGDKLASQYAKLAVSMKDAAARGGEFVSVFKFLEKTASVLALKANIGTRMKSAYDAGDKKELSRISKKVLPELIKRTKKLRRYHRDMWFEMYKPLGWETMDIKYGALIARLDTARLRLSDYVAGRVSALAELAEPRLYYKGEPGRVREVSITKMMSAGRISK